MRLGSAIRNAVALAFAALVSLSAQDLANYSIERIQAGLRFAEGPAWSGAALLWSDTVTNKIYSWTGRGAAQPSDRPGGPSGNAFDPAGRLYSCEFRERRVTRYDSKKSKLEVLADKFEGKRFNAPNDLVVRKDGHIWFTDPAFGNQASNRELDFYGIFHISPKGELDVVAKWQTRPNGITLSPNGRILYVSNSDERAIYAFDLDRGANASNPRVVISGIEGVPGGIRTDEKGNLYVAAKYLFVYSHDAKLLGKIETAETPSNCTFGDGDLSTLYITAKTSVFRVKLGVKGASY